MKIAFVYRGAENLGIEYLSSYLKAAGHETRLFFDPASFSGDRISRIGALAFFSPDYLELIARAIMDWAPDLVAYSAYTASYQWALEVARRVKALHPAPSVFGGIHVTADPERVLARNEVDAVVAGEGEGALLDLVNSLDGGRFTRHDIPNAGFRIDGEYIINPPRPFIRDVDALPMPDKGMFYEKSKAFSFAYMVMTGRGCPYKCRYCCNSLYPLLYPNEDHAVRQRSVGNVIEELLPWRAVPRIFTFWDDVFPTDKVWLDEFIEEYRRHINKPFMCFVHPSRFSEEHARRLKEAGCFNVKIGIQTITRAGGKVLGRMSNEEKVREMAAVFDSYGITYSMDHMLDLPGETEEDLVRTAHMYNEMKPIRVNSHWLSHFPGTPLLEDAVKEGRLTPEREERVREGIGQTTFMLPADNTVDSAHMLMVLDMIPLLPKSWINCILEKNRWKRIPFNKFAHQLLLTVQSLLAGDHEIQSFIRYALGPKNAP